jgi:hypothetical protein
VEAYPGGTILLRWINFGATWYTGKDSGLVLEALAPRRFVFKWTPGDSTITVEFDLARRGPGTVVTVEERGHTMSQRDLEALVECAAEWGEALTLLKALMEQGITYGEVSAPGGRI